MTDPVLDPRVRGTAGSRTETSGSFEATPSSPVAPVSTADTAPVVTKEALTEVIHGVLFESGFLEKFVHRAVDKKLKGSAGGGSSQEEVVAACKAELGAVVESKVADGLSGEAFKVLIDDKFRAITLYLQTEVIPKAVAQILQKSNTEK